MSITNVLNMSNFWNQRYGMREYAYGEDPNAFFREQIDRLKPGKLLLPGEGEGRNAVYAARKGWDVTAFDLSDAGKEKALQLAKKFRVQIDYLIIDFEHVEFPENTFDCIAFVFNQYQEPFRKKFHDKTIRFMKPGGKLIMESFSKNQLLKRTGGPKDLDLLYTVDDLKDDFNSLKFLSIVAEDVHLNEGPFHQGIASVIRLTGNK